MAVHHLWAMAAHTCIGLLCSHGSDTYHAAHTCKMKLLSSATVKFTYLVSERIVV